MWIDGNLLIIDIYRLFSATWKGVLLATPIWICWLMIKIKWQMWRESR